MHNSHFKLYFLRFVISHKCVKIRGPIIVVHEKGETIVSTTVFSKKHVQSRSCSFRVAETAMNDTEGKERIWGESGCWEAGGERRSGVRDREKESRGFSGSTGLGVGVGLGVPAMLPPPGAAGTTITTMTTMTSMATMRPGIGSTQCRQPPAYKVAAQMARLHRLGRAHSHEGVTYRNDHEDGTKCKTQSAT